MEDMFLEHLYHCSKCGYDWTKYFHYEKPG